MEDSKRGERREPLSLVSRKSSPICNVSYICLTLSKPMATRANTQQLCDTNGDQCQSTGTTTGRERRESKAKRNENGDDLHSATFPPPPSLLPSALDRSLTWRVPPRVDPRLDRRKLLLRRLLHLLLLRPLPVLLLAVPAGRRTLLSLLGRRRRGSASAVLGLEGGHEGGHALSRRKGEGRRQEGGGRRDVSEVSRRKGRRENDTRLPASPESTP